jgi:TPR repeat protein
VRDKYAGDPKAMTALAARIIVGRNALGSPVDGDALLREAARQGDAEAWGYLAVLAASGVGRAQSWADAFDALHRAAELGDTQAARQRELLAGVGVAGADDVAGWIAPLQTRLLHEAPRVAAHTAFFRRRCAPI